MDGLIRLSGDAQTFRAFWGPRLTTGSLFSYQNLTGISEMGGEFGGSKLQVPPSAQSDRRQIFESYVPGPMATPVVMTETSGKDIRITTVGGMTVRQTVATNILAGIAAENNGKDPIDVSAVVQIALRLADSLIFQTRDDVEKFKNDEVPDTDK